MGHDAGEGRRQGPLRLPDLCNMGVWLRVLLAVNAGALFVAAARAADLAALEAEFLGMAVFVEPIALGSLVALCAARDGLERLGRWPATAAAILVPMALAEGYAWLLGPMFAPGSVSWRTPLWAAIGAVLVLYWFTLRHRAQAPAVTEARLMALTARIRPHFLFNSLNAVLGVIRSDPRRAEAALEELAELFRALMRDNRELVPLSAEIALARQYLELEKLRLGERLRVRWDVDSCPPDAQVPPLMLQPLLENAVYHGIEPLQEEGEIAVRIAGDKGRVAVEVSNPYAADSDHHPGAQMALANIRERLMLFFDLEAELETTRRDGRYVIRIAFPYRKGDTV